MQAAVLTVLAVAPAALGFYLKRKNRLTADRLCMLLIFGGIVLRLMYISYTDVTARQHDVGDFLRKTSGHAGYIKYLLRNRHLPDFDPRLADQFYHPPLHHIIGALVLAAVRALGFDPLRTGPVVLQYIAAAYSSLFSVLMWRTLRHIGIKDEPLVLACAVSAYHPTLIILSGSINNDMLSIVLGTAAVFFTVRWSKERRLRDIIGAAFALGFGMMAKLSAALLAPAIAAVFITVLVKKRKEWKSLLTQFIVFGCICAPIGLCCPVRNLVMFGVPFGYIPALGKDSGQYISKTPVERITDWSLFQLSSPFTQWEWYHDDYNEFNPIIALLKNAMFDEDAPFIGSLTLQSFCTALFFAGAAVAAVSVFAVITLFSRKEKLPFELKLMFAVMYAVTFGSYIIFCFRYPQVCTQNMRYCVPLIVSGTAALGLLMRRAPKSGRLTRCFAKAARGAIPLMCAFSAFVYAAQMYLRLGR